MTSRFEQRRAGGFTLIEILVVLAVLALAAGLIVMRGPARPRAIDLSAVAMGLADTLRLARAQAIAANRPTQVLVDAERRHIAAPGGAVRPIPAEIGIAFHSLMGPLEAPRLIIRFAPDGSSSGGAVDLSSGGKRVRVGVAWLTGRVSVTDVP
jgi:general secretion pathway protein H